jgi:DNA repair protein SbcC/Rad50
LNKAGKDLISQGATGMSVSLSFRARRDECRVSRAIDGATATARLEIREPGKWHTVSGSLGEIGRRVERIIGLDFDAFTKSVILPQGKFDQFPEGAARDAERSVGYAGLPADGAIGKRKEEPCRRAALEKRRDSLAALRAEAEVLPGRIDLARRKCELSDAAIESAAGRLRALAERIRTAESTVLEAQSSYEGALGDERSASQALQNAHHNRKLISNQIGNIDELAISLRKEIASLEEDLQGAPPLEEIAARLSAVNHARQECAGLEASRSRAQNDLKQAEELAARCARDAEALQSIQTRCTAAIEELDLEIGRLAEQVRGHFGGLEAPDS